MAEHITGIRTESGPFKIDYKYLANLPKADTTLSKSGEFADAKSVGEELDSVKSSLESGLDALSGDLDTLTTQVSDWLATKLDKSGGTMTGAINMSECAITNLLSPTNDGDAANKAFVDENIKNLDTVIKAKNIYKLTDVIDTFPTTMKTLADAMPKNSMIVVDMRSIAKGAAYEITDFGVDSTFGTAIIVRGYDNNRLCMLVIHGTGDATQSYLRVGNYAINTNVTNWINLSEHNPLDAYPIGSIYMATNSKSPAERFGGTWERLKDKFLLGAGDTYTAGNTGGAAKVTLTVAQMPTHRHQLHFGSRYNTGTISTKQIWPGAEVGNNSSGNEQIYKDVTTPIETMGSGEAHNNMPPYLAVYMWKRTA